MGATLLVVLSWAYQIPPQIPTGSPSPCTFSSTTKASNNAEVQIYYCYSPTTSTSQTFSVAFGANNYYGGVGVMAFSRTVGSTVDQQNNGTANSTSIQAGSVTPLSNNEVIIAMMAVQAAFGGSGVPTIGSGFTLANSSNGVSGTTISGAQAYFVQSTAAAINPQWSWTTSNDAAAVIATFR